MTPSETAELREFISGELQKVHGRFDGVDSRFDGVDGCLDGIDGRLDEVRTDQLDFRQQVDNHFAKVYEGLNDVSTRLARQETQGEEMRKDFRAFGENLESTNRRVEELQTQMDTGFRDVRVEMKTGFQSVRAEMADGLHEVRTEMAEGFQEVRTEMAEGFQEVRTEMAEGFKDVRTEMADGFKAQGELIRSILPATLNRAQEP